MELTNHLQKAVQSNPRLECHNVKSKDAKRNCQDPRLQGIYTEKGQIKAQRVFLMTSLTPRCSVVRELWPFPAQPAHSVLARLALLEVGAFQAVGGDDVKPHNERRQRAESLASDNTIQIRFRRSCRGQWSLLLPGGRMRGCRSLEMDSYCIQYLAFWPFSTPD